MDEQLNNDRPLNDDAHNPHATGAIPYMPSAVLNFFVSIVPGAGQMYQGLMRRGVFIMCVFAGFIVLSSILGQIFFGIGDVLTGIAVTGIVVTYFFSFFDSIRTCRLLRRGLTLEAYTGALDAPIDIEKLLKAGRGKGRAAVGVILVVIGALGVGMVIIRRYVPDELVRQYVRPAMEFIFPGLLLVVGVILLLRSRRTKA